MKVVVTGSSGRLGRVLIPWLRAHPAITGITGIDRAPFPQPLAGEGAPYREILADIRTPGLAEHMADADALVHMAFVLMGGGLGGARHDREHIRDVNVAGSRHVFEAAAAAGIRRLVFVSSAAVYGAWPDNPPRIREDQRLRPNPGFAYGEDKAAVEQWLDGFEAAQPGTTVIRLRPHAILGPHAHPLLRLIVRQPFYPAVGSPEPLTQCVWETDVAEAIKLALLGAPAGAYNLAAQPAMSLRAMLALNHRHPLPFPLKLAEPLHRLAWRLTPLAGEPGWVHGMRHNLAVETSKAREVLGWNPRFDTRQCIAQLTRPV